MSINSGYLVVIEWDGMKPPTAFYHRIRKLTSGVRQNDSETLREMSPFARREERNDNAVIMQEGAIYCVSKSLARSLALLAQQYGAVNVEVATVEKMDPIVATTEDLEALSRIQKILGRRGRPPAHVRHREVSITCLEEVHTYIRTIEGYSVLNCPVCGSLAIDVHRNAIMGSPLKTLTWSYGPTFTAFGTWIVKRTIHSDYISFYELDYNDGAIDWSTSLFDSSPYAKYDTMIAPNSGINIRYAQYTQQQKDILRLMINSDLDNLDTLTGYPEDFVRILDAIFISRLRYSKEEQLEARLVALSGAMIRYPEVGTQYLLALDDNKVDFFDAASVIPPKEMLDYFSTIRTHKRVKVLA